MSERLTCPTCGAEKPEENEFCSDGFHALGPTYWPLQLTDDLIEEVARAISRAMSVDLHGGKPEDYAADDWEDFIGEAKAALSTIIQGMGE